MRKGVKLIFLRVAFSTIMLLGTTAFLGITGSCMEKPESNGDQKRFQAMQKTDYVKIDEYIPSVIIEPVYYTDKNFTGQKLYDIPEAYLRKGTADKLKAAAGEVGAKGYRLKIWDAYRPPRVQYKMWEAFPNPNYLANPYKKPSDHSRGCAVDLTLTDSSGKELEMPSPFDEFSPRADRDYRDVSPVQGANAAYLEDVMKRHGFISIRTEWWHFSDCERGIYSVTDDFPVAE
ncbi:MAG: M15 family metallopeptidase [Peptococcaceae bacterium]|nr:M15 family metallopeptidase [Peptococcaceae bacterium]